MAQQARVGEEQPGLYVTFCWGRSLHLCISVPTLAGVVGICFSDLGDKRGKKHVWVSSKVQSFSKTHLELDLSFIEAANSFLSSKIR